MARRVFLHIGTMKSATTYIQDLCDTNRDAMLAEGILWPYSWISFAATKALVGTGPKPAWNLLNAEIKAHDGDVLISNELLAAIKDEQIGQIVDAIQGTDLQIIITARDLARVIPSQWQTMTRNRRTVPWKTFVKATKSRLPVRGTTAGQFWRKQDLAAIVQRWSAFVPLDQITLVTVPPQGSKPSVLVERFGSVLGIDLAALQQPRKSNPALGAQSAELLRRLNLRTKDWDAYRYRLAFKNAAARYVLEARASHEPKVSLAQKDMKWVHRRSKRMIEEVERTGVRVVGDLQDLVPTIEVPEAPVDPGALSDSDLLEVAEYAAVGLGGLLADSRMAYNTLVDAVVSLDPIDTNGAEWQEFVPIDEEQEGDSIAGTRRGRFLVWRAERRRAAAGDAEPAKKQSETLG